jgi:chromosomal replication initiation ATPase DnaA
LFVGPGGTGKSHLAQAIGQSAIQQGQLAFGSDVKDVSFGDGVDSQGNNIYLRYKTNDLKKVAAENLKTREHVDNVRGRPRTKPSSITSR